MIVVTGAAGFIGSVLVAELNARGRSDLLLVDAFGRPDRSSNLENKRFEQKIERNSFEGFLATSPPIEVIYHIGARTDTAEQDTALFDKLNVEYSKMIWRFCAKHRVPLIYASSAATYGSGEHGYSDRHDEVAQLEPLNPYGHSKQTFDEWALSQTETPPFWAGLKFFNVYGPNEYHKSRMASVVYHAFKQISATGQMKLFRSHRADIADGQQSRDFIYVRDVVAVALWLNQHRPASGLYNLGTGQARPFIDLVHAVFAAMEKPPEVSYIDTPADIRDTYQYYTQADMSKLRAAGYQAPFYSLEDGVLDYVSHYLLPSANNSPAAAKTL